MKKIAKYLSSFLFITTFFFLFCSMWVFIFFHDNIYFKITIFIMQWSFVVIIPVLIFYLFYFNVSRIFTKFKNLKFSQIKHIKQLSNKIAYLKKELFISYKHKNILFFFFISVIIVFYSIFSIFFITFYYNSIFVIPESSYIVNESGELIDIKLKTKNYTTISLPSSVSSINLTNNLSLAEFVDYNQLNSINTFKFSENNDCNFHIIEDNEFQGLKISSPLQFQTYITTIKNYSFADLGYLSNIFFPKQNYVLSGGIGSYAFANLGSKIKSQSKDFSVNIPPTTSIGEYVFSGIFSKIAKMENLSITIDCSNLTSDYNASSILANVGANVKNINIYLKNYNLASKSHISNDLLFGDNNNTTIHLTKNESSNNDAWKNYFSIPQTYQNAKIAFDLSSANLES